MKQQGLDIEGEGLVLSRYLIDQSPSVAVLKLYEQAVLTRGDTRYEKTFSAALHRPNLLPFLDAYDAWRRPNSQLRQRLYLMFSILEATPDATQKFLPNKRSGWYLVAAGLLGARALFRLAVGSIIVRLWGL